jgi:hypothetical protein
LILAENQNERNEFRIHFLFVFFQANLFVEFLYFFVFPKAKMKNFPFIKINE